jgi:predicted ABC-type ATPase
VNADRIAADRFGTDAEARSYEAGEIAAAARSALIAARIDFCTETVFSHPSKLELIDAAIVAGYEVVCHVVMIPLELSGARVAARVAAGGHSVPPAKLPGRYQRLWPNVASAVPRCHRIVFWDNSRDDGPTEVAAYRYGLPDYPPRWPIWTPAPVAHL